MDKHSNVVIFSKDNSLGGVIRDYLKEAGWNAEIVDPKTGKYEGFPAEHFSFALVDCRQLSEEVDEWMAGFKREGKEIPVIGLCDCPTREEVRRLFSLQVDGLMRQPLDFEVLVAYMQAVWKRYRLSPPPKKVTGYVFGRFRFDLAKQTLSVGERVIRLTTKETELLTLLCQHANRPLNRIYALETIWKTANYANARSMDVYIIKLRKLLKEDPTVGIVNIPKRGFQLSTHLKYDD